VTFIQVSTPTKLQEFNGGKRKENRMELAQLSVFLDLKQGSIAELAELFGREGINFRALTLSDTKDFGILRFIVDDSDKAEEILRANHFTVVVSEVVAVEVEDKPGALGEVYRILDQKKIKVDYMYAFSQGPSNKAVLVFSFENNEEAVKSLREHNVRVLSADKVQSDSSIRGEWAE
jgi:hypothetical protein